VILARFRGFTRFLPLLLVATALPVVANADTSVTGQQLVSSVRSGRTTFDYTYTITVQNGTPALTSATATVTSSSPATLIVKGTVSLGDLPASAIKTSTDTFTIRQDRTLPFNPSTLQWTIKGQSPSVASAIANLENTGQLPSLDRSTSLTGPDSNGNGVRDDIEAYVASLPDSAAQKAALLQTAKALGAALTAGGSATDNTTLQGVGTAIGRAVHCIWTRYDSSVAGDRVTTIRNLVVNTQQRFTAYEQYNTKRSGTESRGPSGDSCDAP
jgi:hypothetical protein